MSIEVLRSSPEPKTLYETDNLLWEVPCKVRIILCCSTDELQARQQVGHEEVTVFNIMKWSLHDEIPATGGVAAFGRATLPGRVFLEAPSLEGAKRMIANVSHVTPDKVKPVPGDDYPSCLTEGNTYTPLVNHWVRLRRPRLYKGDIALITHVDERSLLIDVAFVPRLDFTDNKNTSGRPPQKLVNAFEAERLLGPGSVSLRNGRFLLMDKELYCESGQRLLRDLDTESYIPAEAMPTITELDIFKPSYDVPEAALTKTRGRIVLESLQFGDQVKILVGEYQGLLGEVEAIDGLEVQVTIPTQGVTQGILMPYLRRNFQIGDEVLIATGPNAGFTGWVTTVETGTEGDPRIFVVNTSQEKEVLCLRVERYLLLIAHPLWFRLAHHVQVPSFILRHLRGQQFVQYHPRAGSTPLSKLSTKEGRRQILTKAGQLE